MSSGEACACGRIDVHAHFLPDVYARALARAGLTTLDGGFPVPRWSAAAAIEMMDRQETTTAIVSLSSPSSHFLPPADRPTLVREVNDAGAELEYDPEWGRAFWTGTVAASCDHARMLAAVKVPVLFTHHFRYFDDETGFLMGAISDLQVRKVRELIEAGGQPFDYRSFPQMGHAMHGQDPQLFANTLSGWASAILRETSA